MDRPSKQHQPKPPAPKPPKPAANAPASSSKRPRWTTSTFGAASPALDKGKGREEPARIGARGRADGSSSGARDRTSRVAPPAFALPTGPSKPVKQQQQPTTRARLPPLPLKQPAPADDGGQQRPEKKARTSTGSALGHLPLPFAAPSPAPSKDASAARSPASTPMPKKETRPLPSAPSFGAPRTSASKPAAAPARRTVALSSVVPVGSGGPGPQTPTHKPKSKVERELVRGLLDIPQAKERLQAEDGGGASAAGAGAQASAVKVEDALLGVSPRKARRSAGSRGGNLQTAASLLLTSHHAALGRFYQTLLAQRTNLPPADIEFRIVSLPPSSAVGGGGPTSPPAPKQAWPFQKARPPVKRVPLVCTLVRPADGNPGGGGRAVILVPSSSAATPSPVSASVDGPGAGAAQERVHVLLKLDEHSTALPPAVSRWAKLRVGQRVLGWKPWLELGPTTAPAGAERAEAGGSVTGERIVGLERFVVLD